MQVSVRIVCMQYASIAYVLSMYCFFNWNFKN